MSPSSPGPLPTGFSSASTAPLASIARARWDELSPNARKPYGLAAHSGRPLDGPGDQSHLPPDQQFEQFAVIAVALSTVDILRLGDEGAQIRALARFTSDGIDASWIGP